MSEPSTSTSSNAGSADPADAGSPLGFVHLRMHSAYSMAEGAIPVKKLVKLAVDANMPALALTDTRNMFGALEFSVASIDAGLQPIIGCQISVRREDVEAPRGAGGGAGLGRNPPPDTLVLLAATEQGYLNLMALVSKAFLETDGGETPQVSVADLAARAEGLIALTAGINGAVGRLLLAGQKDAARAMLTRLAGIYPGSLYVELSRHDLPEEDATEAAFIDMAYALDLPLVATNEAFFDTAGMFEAHDALICIADKTFLSLPDRRRYTPEFRFKTAAEMRELFRDLPEAVDNTLVIARRCAVMSELRAPILPTSSLAEGQSETEALRELSIKGLETRLEEHVFTPDMDTAAREDARHRYHQRLDYELGVIENMGFPGYFLIVADFIQWSKDHDIPVGPGRGSGAGSVVAWALTITDLDPLRFNLLFERFLNPERVSMPDFDIDFCQDRREEVIEYVQGAYGRDRVAQIITFGKLQARAVLRNVGRVLEMPLGYVDKICKMVPNNPAKPVTLQQAIDQEIDLMTLRRTDESVARLLDISLKLEGLYSHASTHAAGVVIGDRPLDELVPLYRDPNADMPVTEFNMKWVEQAGLVKFDFLGLKTLTVIQRAVELLARRGVELDISAISLADRPTFDLLSRGDTAGVFQLESAGMRDVLKKLKPDVFEDIIAVVALYRPGPMDNIPSFIARKNGSEPVEYMHESLAGILEETYGIMIYQEQVMQAAQEMAGYTLGGADLLRRAMGKKIQAEMDKQRETFVEGATARGISDAKARQVFEQINAFAGYGFNKSHAAAYALVAYQTAFLKANYPVEFMAAIMTYDMHNTDKLSFFKGEVERLGIEMLPPDVNHSEVKFSVEPDAEGNGAIRYALGAIRNVGEGAMAALVAEREASGPFKDVTDFANRLDTKVVNKRLLENLIRAGALDGLHPVRAALYEGLDGILGQAQLAAEERGSSQENLFGGVEAGPKIRLSDRREWPNMEKLTHECAAIGFYLSAHPLDAYADKLERLDVVPIRDLPARVRPGSSVTVRMAGTFVSRKERISERGSKYAYALFSDASGSYETILFAETLSASRDLMDGGEPLLLTVTASMEPEGEEIKLRTVKAEGLTEVIARDARHKKLKVFFDHAEALDPLKEILAAEARGQARIVLVARGTTQEVDVELPHKYAISAEMISRLNDVPGLELREF